FRELVETMNEGLVVVDGEGLITYCNQRFADLLGLEREGLEGRDAKQVVGPEFRIGRSCRAGGQPGCRYELDLTPASGGQRTVSISIAPVFGEGARFTGSLSVIADMTEVRLLEQKLNQAHRLESVGQLAAGIAHEINTPAQYVFNNVKFLKDTMPGVQAVLDASAELARLARDSGPFAESAQALGLALDRVDPQMFREDVLGAIDETLEGITRISWIVQSVKRFAHPGLDKIVPTDLNEAIGSTVTVSTNEWKYVADLDLDLDPALPLVPCVPGELNQFLLNLITNAAHSIGEKLDKNPQDKGRITISTGLAGDRVEIRVKDTGQGIPESIRSRIFDPFFTTKPVGRGTGQGLSIARTQITERLGGEIDFETEEGVGTTFIIRLPLEPRAEAGPDAGADAGE
ncbi:MAG: ATP-binding protein, partial [Desulfovibrionaceae bacterium]|nr:ATP-binding protein [Desulfovibrionaceae bacterium]